MSAKIIDGKEIARLVRADWKIRADKLEAAGVMPGLAVIMIGENASPSGFALLARDSGNCQSP